MIANNILFSEKVSADLRMRSLFHNLPSPYGTVKEWDKTLKEFDSRLNLRFNPESENFLVFCEEHGTLLVIWSFAQDESFGMAFANIRHKSSLRMKHIRKMRKAEIEAEEKRKKDLIADCSHEFGTELHHATRNRLTNDNVDDFAPKKAGLGGVIL